MNRLSARSGTILAFLAIGLTLGFAVTGMGFGLWIQQFSVQETLESGNVDLFFSSAFTDDDGTVDDVLLDSLDNASSTEVFDAWGASSSADPAATGPDPKVRYDKDVARCEALIDGSVTQDAAYPRYNCTSWFSMQNSGTVPVKLRRIRVNTISGPKNLDPAGTLVTIDVDDADFDGDNSTGSDVEVGASEFEVCQQIDPGETVRIAVSGQTLKQAPQGNSLNYTVDVEAAQWNELSTSTEPLTHLYEDVFRVLGHGGVVLPLADFPPEEFFACPIVGMPPAGGDGFVTSTFATIGAAKEVFTWTEPPASFDTPGSLDGIVPVVTLNGIDEHAVAPDVPGWSPGNGLEDAPFSVGLWVKVTDTSSIRKLLSRWDSPSAQREWTFYITSSDKLYMGLYDESENLSPSLATDAAIPMGTWTFVVMTYDGTGGPFALSGMTLYVDGIVPAQTANDKAGYLAMEDLTVGTTVGSNLGGALPFDGEMAGGPLGPIWIGKELSADEVSKLFDVGAQALGLGP
jgi:hypothetical protein